MIRWFYQFLWHLRQTIKKMGIFGLLACIIFSFTGIYLYTTFTEINASKATLMMKSKVIQSLPVNRNQDAKSESLSQVDTRIKALLSVVSLLPGEDSLPSILNKVHQKAKQFNLNIISADYKWRKLRKTSQINNKNLVQYEITFPLEGSYPSIRNMVNGVMAENPNIALDSIEFEREGVTTSFCQARVTFVVFMLGNIE